MTKPAVKASVPQDQIPSDVACDISEDTSIDDAYAVRKLLAILCDQLDTLISVNVEIAEALELRTTKRH